MIFDQANAARRSLGFLRKAAKTKDRSPDHTGTLKLQRHTLETIAKQLQEMGADEIECCLASWRNIYANGESYATVELSPKYVSRRHEPPNDNLADFI